MSALARWKERVRLLKRDTLALYLASRHPRVPWTARLFIAAVAAYALSPIDLIPDIIPVLGYLDDLLLVPLGIWLALKMIPPDILAECRAAAETRLAEGQPVSRTAAAVIIALWLLAAAWLGWVVWRWVGRR
jgi:uncharacterized membrane protein YkvA (DUF1232 family)